MAIEARSDGSDRESSLHLVGEAVQLLYIEDNPSNLKLVERIVGRRSDMALHTATSGRAGLEAARRLVPNLILLDLNLPDVRGDDILRELKADPQTAGIPIVVLSADATREATESSIADGADGYLTKPIDLTTFFSVIEGLLAETDAG